MAIADQSFSRESNEYKYGFVTEVETERLPKGLNEEIDSGKFLQKKKNLNFY